MKRLRVSMFTSTKPKTRVLPQHAPSNLKDALSPSAPGAPALVTFSLYRITSCFRNQSASVETLRERAALGRR